MVKIDDVIKIIEKLRVAGSAKGVSRVAIKGALPTAATAAQTNLALRWGVANGKLIQVKDSFKVAAVTAPKKKKSAPKKKKAAPKKKAATKRKPKPSSK